MREVDAMHALGGKYFVSFHCRQRTERGREKRSGRAFLRESE